MSKLIEYFEKYLLASLEKQEAFEALVGEHLMQMDLESGKVRLNGLELAFQVLGTESENTLTYLWAWSEEQTEIPEALMHTARELREWGKREGVPEFSTPEIDINRADGVMISVVASGISRAGCYYGEHYEGGALFILLNGAGLDTRPSFTRAALTRRFLDMVSRYDFNHRSAFVSYFRMKGLPCSEAGETVNAELENGERLIAEFGRNGRITAMNGEAV